MVRTAALLLILALAAFARPALAQGQTVETLEQTLCRFIEHGARTRSLPVHFFTRLIFAESGFRLRAVSPAGAQGVAQFMPGTAAERGLADPFDPEQAIAHSAAFLADLMRRFGNWGLAAAAYNAGPNRVQGFLDGRPLPAETQTYVWRITGRSAESWLEESRRPAPAGDAHDLPAQPCLMVTAQIRRPGGPGTPALAEGPFAPWGVQLAGNFSRRVALASYGRARASLAGILGDVQPMILGQRLRSFGRATYWRVRAPARSRRVADALCERIRGAGGACIVLRN